jgi:uncharacterized membrane protein
MNMNKSDLIQKLAASHEKKPFWKNRRVLLTLWFCLNFGYYILMVSFFSKLDPKSSGFFLFLSVLTSVVGWLFFARFLNADDEGENIKKLGILSVLGILTAAFFFDGFVTQNVLNQRALSITQGDFSCFTHTVLAGILPLVLGSFFIRYFFTANKLWAFIFLSFHVSALSVIWTEMTCPEREIWHLLFGHQLSVVGILGITIFLNYLVKRRAFSIS